MIGQAHENEVPGALSNPELQYKNLIKKRLTALLFLSFSLILVTGISVLVGSADISPYEAYSTLLNRFFPGHFATTRTTDLILWKFRLPRVFIALWAGSGLASTGSVMQGVFRNPLADPYMMGIASAAGFGAALAIASGIGFFQGRFFVIANAFTFALLCSLLIIILSGIRRATPESMILIGVSMVFLFSAATTILQYFAESEAVKAAMFWMVGDLGRTSWQDLEIVVPIVLVCMLVLVRLAPDLNILMAGDDSAQSLGVRVKRTRLVALAVCSFMVASVVAFTGTIGFVGLAAPHICRIIFGSDYKFLIPASAMIGALLLLISDAIARTIISPLILPVGVVTAFFGVPVLVYLVMNKRGANW